MTCGRGRSQTSDARRPCRDRVACRPGWHQACRARFGLPATGALPWCPSPRLGPASEARARCVHLRRRTYPRLTCPGFQVVVSRQCLPDELRVNRRALRTGPWPRPRRDTRDTRGRGGRRAIPPGGGCRTAQAAMASSLAITSGVSKGSTSIARRFSSTCPTRLAPVITVETCGFIRHQAIAS